MAVTIITKQYFIRGHCAYWDAKTETSRYCDDDTEVDGNHRACVQCGQMPTQEGHDPCLGYIPGAIAACCGHGVENGFISWPLSEKTPTETSRY